MFSIPNFVFPILLAVQIALLIIAGITRKEALFLVTLIFGGLCVSYIRFFIDASGGLMSGSLEKELFFLLMPCFFRAVAIFTFMTQTNLAPKMTCRRPWGKILGVSLVIAFALDLFCVFLPWLLPQLAQHDTDYPHHMERYYLLATKIGS